MILYRLKVKSTAPKLEILWMVIKSPDSLRQSHHISRSHVFRNEPVVIICRTFVVWYWYGPGWLKGRSLKSILHSFSEHVLLLNDHGILLLENFSIFIHCPKPFAIAGVDTFKVY